MFVPPPTHSFCLSSWVSPFAGKGGITRDRLGRHVVVRVRTVEEGLSSLALGKGGVYGEAWTLRTQRGVTWWHAIFCFVTGARGEKVWWLGKKETKHGVKLPAMRNQWFEVKLCVDLSVSACVMEMRGGMRRGRVVGRDTLFSTSGERVRSRGRSQQGTCRVRRKSLSTVLLSSCFAGV